MPSSSLVEVEVEVGVEVGVEVEVGVGVEVWVEVGVEVGVGAWVKMQFSFLTFSVRWVGGWEEKWRLKLTSAKVEVEAELGNIDSGCQKRKSYLQVCLV